MTEFAKDPRDKNKKASGQIAIDRLSDRIPGAVSERLTEQSAVEEDEELELGVPTIRPNSFDEYPGQDSVKANLKIYVEAAKRRGKPMDHTILHGPPGLGKTTLATIVAKELAIKFYATSGPAIDRPGDLAGILTGLEANSLLFIDEIHRLSIKVEEVLYGAMEDFAIDILIGQGAAARTVRIDIPPFTLVGATTRLSLLSRPLLMRFGIQERLDFYTDEALIEIVGRSARIMGIALDRHGATEIACRSRGTPRLANRLLKRVWDFALIEGSGYIDQKVAASALARQGIDELGLDRLDRAILRTITEQYSDGPVGIETIAATLNEDRATVEDVYEPFLVHKGLLIRGPRGRMISDRGKRHLRDERPLEGRHAQQTK